MSQRVTDEDSCPAHTDWERSERYDLMNEMTLPDKPKLVWSLESKVWCSMVSKAALRSKLIKTEGLPSSAERYMLSSVESKAVSVEWWRL